MPRRHYAGQLIVHHPPVANLRTSLLKQAIATHGYKEVEDRHNPLYGHGKSFLQSSQSPCMPCSFRLCREGKDDFGAGLQQAAHAGNLEWVAFCLNRLLENIDEGRLTVVKAILEPDSMGCNAMMHAANDTKSGFAGFTIRMLVHAAAFSTPDVDKKEKVIRKVLNRYDYSNCSPALACATLMNFPAMEAFVALGAKVADKKVNKGASSHADSIASLLTTQHMGNLVVGNMLRALMADGVVCSYCGSPAQEGEVLATCGRCNLAKYCSRTCQKKHYKKQ